MAQEYRLTAITLEALSETPASARVTATSIEVLLAKDSTALAQVTSTSLEALSVTVGAVKAAQASIEVLHDQFPASTFPAQIAALAAEVVSTGSPDARIAAMGAGILRATASGPTKARVAFLAVQVIRGIGLKKDGRKRAAQIIG